LVSFELYYFSAAFEDIFLATLTITSNNLQYTLPYALMVPKADTYALQSQACIPNYQSYSQSFAGFSLFSQTELANSDDFFLSSSCFLEIRLS
jgi:hypothetical protein